MKHLAVTVVLASLLSFFVGLQLAKKPAETLVHIRTAKILQEVRDNNFNKCEATGATARDDGVIEESWKCPRVKLFVVKRYVTTDQSDEVAR
jgi:hypothetical protein